MDERQKLTGLCGILKMWLLAPLHAYLRSSEEGVPNKSVIKLSCRRKSKILKDKLFASCGEEFMDILIRNTILQAQTNKTLAKRNISNYQFHDLPWHEYSEFFEVSYVYTLGF